MRIRSGFQLLRRSLKISARSLIGPTSPARTWMWFEAGKACSWRRRSSNLLRSNELSSGNLVFTFVGSCIVMSLIHASLRGQSDTVQKPLRLLLSQHWCPVISVVLLFECLGTFSILNAVDLAWVTPQTRREIKNVANNFRCKVPK
jgi:hypothetical protein